MKVERIEWHPRALPRRERFATSRHASDVANVTFVRLEAEGIEGWGAASPSDVTGESPETVAAALPKLAAGLRGFAFERAREVADRMDAILRGNPAAKAAIDLATFDVLAKAKGVPLFRLLGGSKDGMITDRTVGLMDPEAAASKAQEFVAKGFLAVKVKLEGRTGEDLQRVVSIRETLGSHILIRTDANQAFTYRAALAFAKQAYPHLVEFLEQPLPAADLEGMRDLTNASPVPIMADESVITHQDAAKVGWGKCARLVNLKLMKTGGISRALEANAVCESAGMVTMAGCNAESALSIAAGLHFAASQRNVRFADLDSHFNLEKDPASGLSFEKGFLKVSGRPGLGMRVDL